MTGKAATGQTRLRTVTFTRDPLQIRFRLPADWVERFDEEEGCATYYLPGPHGHDWPIGGALSLWLDLNRQVKPLRATTVKALLEQQQRGPHGQLRERDDGSFLLSDKSTHEEPSHRSVDYLWQLAQAMPRRGAAIATFGFSAALDYYDKPGDLYYGTVKLLDQEISEARIGLSVGRGGRRAR